MKEIRYIILEGDSLISLEEKVNEFILSSTINGETFSFIGGVSAINRHQYAQTILVTSN